MNDDAVVRHAARQAIQARKLPDRLPERTWGGPGTGNRCTICESAVGAEELELELEFRDDDGPVLRTYTVHARCWATRQLGQRGPSDGGITHRSEPASVAIVAAGGAVPDATAECLSGEIRLGNIGGRDTGQLHKRERA